MEGNKLFTIKESADLNAETPMATAIDIETSKSTKPKLAVVINCKRLNVRKESSTQSPVICVLNEGDVIQIGDTIDSWVDICTASGLEGYVMTEYLKED